MADAGRNGNGARIPTYASSLAFESCDKRAAAINNVNDCGIGEPIDDHVAKIIGTYRIGIN
jgi:hypothetical protein